VNAKLSESAHASATFRDGSVKGLLSFAFMRRITSPVPVLSATYYARCDPYPGSSAYLDVISEHEALFKCLFERFLRLPGHPQHEWVSPFISAAQFEESKDDCGIRAELFVRAVTGSDLLPTKKTELAVKFCTLFVNIVCLIVR